MIYELKQGQQGEALPDAVIVFRLGFPSKDAPNELIANVGHFALSTEDKASEIDIIGKTEHKCTAYVEFDIYSKMRYFVHFTHVYNERKCPMISCDVVRQRPELFLACTGLKVAEFDALYPSFSAAWDEYRKKNYVNAGGGRPKLPEVQDKLFFILFYYKLYPIQAAMGVIFGMSQSQVCTWIHTLTPVIRRTLGIENCLPERNPRKLKEVLEMCELHNFLIDGTERERQRPSDHDEQKDFYSGKHKAHTYNNIVIVHEQDQTVAYLSKTYEGSWHDKAICDEERYEFPENSTLQKDRGFQGYEPKDVITYQPKKSRATESYQSEISS